MPDLMMGLVPLFRGDASVLSRSAGVLRSDAERTLPVEPTVAWLDGEADLRPTGVRLPDDEDELDFFSLWLPPLLLLLLLLPLPPPMLLELFSDGLS